MTTDERRARAILVNSETGRGWDHATQTGRNVALGLARAIRASDEAAGMVLVPRAVLQGVRDGIDAEHRPGAFATNFPDANKYCDPATEADNG